MPSEAGSLVGGRYRLAGLAGQGGSGRVWRARDELLDRAVALKEVALPSRDAPGRAALLARAVREARAAAGIDHPGVITVFDVVVHEDTPWIATRLIDGPSLAAAIARDGPLPWRRAADLGAQVADALACAHAAGVAHRALTPGNILLAGPAGDRAVITDFGMAGVRDAVTELTGAGPLRGQLAFLAPEQLDDGETGPPADLWALGAILSAALAGTPPFTGSTPAAIVTAILTKPPARPSRPGPLAGLLDSLLAKDPARRPDAPATAAALRAALASTQAAEPPAAESPATSPAPENPAPENPAPERPGAPRDSAPAAAPERETASAREPAPADGPAPAPEPQPARQPGPGPDAPLAARIASAVRSNPRLAIGIATAIAMIIALLLVVTLFSGTPRQKVPPPGGPQGASGAGPQGTSGAGPPPADTTAVGRTEADVTAAGPGQLPIAIEIKMDYFAHSGAENIHHLHFNCLQIDNSKKS